MAKRLHAPQPDAKPGNVIDFERARAGPHRRHAGYALILAGLVFLIPALLDAWSEIRAFTQFRATTCTVLGKRLAPAGLEGPEPEFTLRLEVNGQQRIALASDLIEPPDEQHARRMLERYALWRDYPCWYDPADPGRALLSHSWSPRPLLGLLPLLAIAFGIGALRSAPRELPHELTPKQRKLRRWNIGLGIGFALALSTLVAAFIQSVPLGRQPVAAAAQEQANAAALASFEAGQLEAVRDLIDAGGSPDLRDAQGVPLLIRALARCGVKAQSGDYGELAVFLLQKGAAVNARAGDGSTPLLAAARACPAPLVRTLIGAGAQVNDHSAGGDSALRLATRQGRADIAQMLRAAGALE